MLYVLLWWAVLLVLGMGFLPFTSVIFRRFRDHGWVFSKTVGLFIAAFVTWVLNVAGVLPFTRSSVLIVTSVLCVLNYVVYFVFLRGFLFSYEADEEEEEERRPRNGDSELRLSHLLDHGSKRLIILEECLFFAILLGWMWIVGFNPEAYGTEKFMDYGFLTAMSRSTRMPFGDMWFAGKDINYYYGGQYITAWLMKGTGTAPGIAYNVMRSVVTAFSFILPFSLVFQLMYDRVNAAQVKRFGRLRMFSEQPDRILLHVPAEQMGPEEGGILRSAKEASRRIRKKGLSEVRKRRAAEAAYRSERFLADLGDGGGEEELSAENSASGAERNESRTDRASGNSARRRSAAGKTGKKMGSRKGAGNPAGPASLLAGLLAGIGTAFGGTFYYVVYGLIKPLADPSFRYWFPDATRYIGYDPDLPDKTIHEFPAYSSILGDLHAHYLNILFVVTVTAVIYAWAQKQERSPERPFPAFRPEILLAGVMTGAFRWTNFWDFPIYFVVCGAVVFFVNLRLYAGQPVRFLRYTLTEAAVMFGAGYAAALPFTLHFDMISSQIALTHSHTLPHQMLIVWGFPAAILIWYAATLMREQHHMRKTVRRLLWHSHRIALPDLAALLFGLCAAGLVMMPEVIYVKDIYGGDHYRANTMFKLTYQAFILFALVTAYALVRVLVVNSFRKFEAEFKEETKQEVELADMLAQADLAARAALREASGASMTPEADAENGPGEMLPDAAGEERVSAAYDTVKEKHRKKGIGRRIRIGAAVFCILVQCLLAGYTASGVYAWFGNVLNPEDRISDDASVFIERRFPDDTGAVGWLNRHAKGQPVILEAAGDSYSDCGRVSVATGLPTVAGWYVHEWLWRSSQKELDRRVKDIRSMYTSDDPQKVRELLDKYKVTYIYIGTLERETYPELQDRLLQKMGKVVYSDGVSTYIMKVR